MSPRIGSGEVSVPCPLPSEGRGQGDRCLWFVRRTGSLCQVPVLLAL